MASRLTPAIAVEGGEQASGLATMVADLLRQNLADSRTRALVAMMTRGDVGLTASDHHLSVTVSFLGRSLSIADAADGTDGEAAAAPYMAGDWLELAHLCSGQGSLLAAWRTGGVRIEPRGRPGRIAAAGYVLSAPAVGEDQARRRRRAVFVAALIAALSARAWRVRASPSFTGCTGAKTCCGRVDQPRPAADSNMFTTLA